MFKLLRFITGLWSPSFLLTRKRLLINFHFWGKVHWIATFFSPKVLSTWFIFTWRESEFWLGNFENLSSRLETNCRILGFLVTIFQFFLRNTAKRYSWIWKFVIHFIQLYIGIYVRKVFLNYFLRGSVEARSFHCRISYQWSLRRCPYFPENAHHTFLWIWLFACLFSWNTAVALIVFP